MQIWTNEADLKKMALEYLFEDGVLKFPDTNREVCIIEDDNMYNYKIDLGGKKIKLDYADAHYLFLALLAQYIKEGTSRIEVKRTKTIKIM